MYLTYVRVILYPSGWKVFAFLNTLHHAFMYAYFAGAAVFSDILPRTGTVQLVVGIAGEAFVVGDLMRGGECGMKEGLWASFLGIGLLGTYFVLWVGDLRGRATKLEEKEGRKEE